jgi:hypothetical protein
MDVKSFVLQTLLAIFAIDKSDKAHANEHTPELACVELELTRAHQKAACAYTHADGTEITVIVMVSRPWREANSKANAK